MIRQQMCITALNRHTVPRKLPQTDLRASFAFLVPSWPIMSHPGYCGIIPSDRQRLERLESACGLGPLLVQEPSTVNIQADDPSDYFSNILLLKMFQLSILRQGWVASLSWTRETVHV
jgi:hypothetical protein